MHPALLNAIVMASSSYTGESMEDAQLPTSLPPKRTGTKEVPSDEQLKAKDKRERRRQKRLKP